MAKSFILSDESINNRGFRILTGGIDLSRFKKNPVMLWMHRRDDGWDFSQVLPIGIWENVRIEDGKLLADPKFDENDKFARLIQSKVENGLIRGCSVGINPVEFSTAEKDLEKGQTRATITKCELYEASIVDLPANKNSVRLFSDTDNASEIPLINNTHMAEEKNDKKLSFKDKAELLSFMKEKFGFEPKAETVEKENQETKEELKNENSIVAWFTKNFGLQPKAKSDEKTTELTSEQKEVETLKNSISEKDKEIENLKSQVENLKAAPGDENIETNQKTDGNLKTGDDVIDTYASAKATWDAVNEIVE